MARPTLPPGEKKEPLSLRIHSDINNELQVMVDETGFTKSFLGELAITCLVEASRKNPEVITHLNELNEQRTSIVTELARRAMQPEL
jgi:hypothetical protein